MASNEPYRGANGIAAANALHREREAAGTPIRVGRPKGSINRSTKEAREAARFILDSVEYRMSLIERAKKGTLPPQVETMLWAYRYGKPKENINITMDQFADVKDADDDVLEERAAQIIADIKLARQQRHEEAMRLLEAAIVEEENTIEVQAVTLTQDPE